MTRQIGNVLFFLFLVANIYGQEIDLNKAKQITFTQGDDNRPSWSPDGSKLAFQTNRNGTWDIYCYDLTRDSIFPIVRGKFNYQHPVWFPDGEKLVFDSDTLGTETLYSCELTDRKIKRLFKRLIRCREASFASSARQVYFSGFDKTTTEWQIYSYDFVYDNLNQLTFSKSRCMDPRVAPDGKHLMYVKTDTPLEPTSIPFINWYGEESHRMDTLKVLDPCWHPGGLKIYFVSDRDVSGGELYSIWENGTHLERITYDSIEIQQPAISPDGKKLALSINGALGLELYLIQLSEE